MFITVISIKFVIKFCTYGHVAERLKVPVLKTGVLNLEPWVRIPLCPHTIMLTLITFTNI